MEYFWPFFKMILEDTLQSWMIKYPEIFVKRAEEYMKYFEFSLCNFHNFTIFPAPGISLTYTD